MSSTRREINEFETELARKINDFLSDNDSTFSQVAFELGKSDRAAYYLADPSAVNNHLKAHEIPFLTIGGMVINFLLHKFSEIHNLKTTVEINGVMDDEICEIASLATRARELMNAGQQINYKIMEDIKQQVQQLEEEWIAKSL